MTLRTKVIAGTILGIALLAGILFYYSHPFTAGANATIFEGVCAQTSTATTTYTSISAGNATTTLRCSVSGATQTLGNAIDINFWMAASSSVLAQVAFTTVWSDGKLNNESYYPELVSTNDNATSTILSYQARNYTFRQVASTTDILTGSSYATTSGTIRLDTPDRAKKLLIYVTVPTGASNALFWAEVNVKKEQ